MKKILIICLFFSLLKTYSQTCATVFDNSNQSNLSNSSTAIDYNQPNNESYCINIKFHFLRNDDGNFYAGSLNPGQSNINATVSLMNFYLNNHGINIVSKGYDYINNSNLYSQTTTTSNCQNISILSYDSSCLNIYINKSSGSFDFGGSGGVGGSKIFISENNFVNDIRNTIHELGHGLGLYHTFHGTNPTLTDTTGCPESINSSNCLTCGDFVCDTPSTACDGTNGCYRDKTNFMDYSSYFYGLTGDHFTLMQGLRMRNYSRFNHQPRISYSCKSIIGLSNICSNQTATYSISTYLNTTPTISWSVSSGLQILSSSNTSSVTIIPSNSLNTNTLETLTLTINGSVLTKEIWIGNPRYTSYIPINGAYNWVCRGYSTNHNVSFPVNNDATSYRWEITLDNDGIGSGYNCNGVSNPSLAKFNNNNSGITTTNSIATFETSTPTASINWGRCSANYILIIYAINSCGETQMSSKYVTVGSPASNPCNTTTTITSNYRMIISPNPIRNSETTVSLTPSQIPCDRFQIKEGINYKEIYGENYFVKIMDMNGNEKYSGDFDLDDEDEIYKFEVRNINIQDDYYIFQVTYPDGYVERQHVIIQKD